MTMTTEPSQASETPARKSGRPRTKRAPDEPSGGGQPPAPPAPPVDLPPTDLEMIDRKGVARMLNKSLSTIAWLEQNDPDFPAPFSLGRNAFMYFVEEIRAFILKKAADAKAEKRKRQIKGGPNQ